MSNELPHPRNIYDLEGGAAAEDAFAGALARGRLHHAWLISGPLGVGKATFAYRVARRLLGAAPADGRGRLGASPDDPVCRLIAGRAHPDLMVLQRDPEDGKSRKQIPVEEARELTEFFSKTPALAAWRVAIVDTADDLNASGANALLKTLEEPPPRGVLLLLSHRPWALLPTIRSRCRILRLQPPPPEAVAERLAARTGLAPGEALALAEMARGAPGRALWMAGQDALAVDAAAGRLLDDTDAAVELACADSFRGAQGAERFALFMDRLAERIRQRARARSLRGETAGLERCAEAWSEVSGLAVQTEALNLDRADAFHSVLRRVRAAAC